MKISKKKTIETGKKILFQSWLYKAKDVVVEFAFKRVYRSFQFVKNKQIVQIS